jgi:glycosyltransferase involved in cell wall biosynthesis
MTECPLVSGLVTVFNRQHILEETVSSFLASSLQDFELILVDDCSTDASWELCNRLQSSDSRIRAFRNEKNVGDYPNRNQAARYARGKYLKYLDADDLIYPYSLQLMVDALQSHADAALALSANVIDPQVPYPEKIKPPEFFRRHFLGRSPIGVGPSAAIIRRESFEAVGGFTGRQFVGDTELWLKLAERWPVVLLPPSLVWWRRHEGQQMSQEMRQPEILNVRFQLELDTLRATSCLSTREKHAAATRLRQIHSRRLLSMALRSRHPLAAWRLFRTSELNVIDLLAGLQKPVRPAVQTSSADSLRGDAR